MEKMRKQYAYTVSRRDISQIGIFQKYLFKHGKHELRSDAFFAQTLFLSESKDHKVLDHALDALVSSERKLRSKLDTNNCRLQSFKTLEHVLEKRDSER